MKFKKKSTPFIFDFETDKNNVDMLKLDFTLFNLLYKDRIGFNQKEFKDGSVKSERGNVGNAIIYGV